MRHMTLIKQQLTLDPTKVINDISLPSTFIQTIRRMFNGMNMYLFVIKLQIYNKLSLILTLEMIITILLRRCMYKYLRFYGQSSKK